MHAWSSIHPALLDGLFCRPDMVDPRCASVAISVTGSKYWDAVYYVEATVHQNVCINCRRLALAALHFAGSRTLSLDEADPFHSASGLSRTSHAAYCAYDPAFVVPAAATLLQHRWVAAESVVRAGWLPLLLRCLGADDAPLRYAVLLHFS